MIMKTNYSIGQEVWTKGNYNKLLFVQIIHIRIDIGIGDQRTIQYQCIFEDLTLWYGQEELFETKQDLKDHLIAEIQEL